MSQRVSIEKYGDNPIIFIAPHGVNDHNTGSIAKIAAKNAECYAVINNGFTRGDDVDEMNDIANLNKVSHARHPHIINEFLEPIKRIKYNVLMHHSKLYLFYIHGCNDDILKKGCAAVLGMGLGTKFHSLTIGSWEACYIADSLTKNICDGDEFMIAKGGNKYAARDANNMNQYFVKHNKNLNIKSMQIEIAFHYRKDANYKQFASQLGNTLKYNVTNLLNNRNTVKKAHFHKGQDVLNGNSPILL